MVHDLIDLIAAAVTGYCQVHGTDSRECGAAREAGATGVWANLLYLKPGTREHFLANLARDWPEELERYERLYANRAYLPAEESVHVRSTVAELRRRYGVGDRRRVRLEPEPEPVQLALAI